MTYDWDGRPTKRIQLAKLVMAIAGCVVLPLAIAAWTYVT